MKGGWVGEGWRGGGVGGGIPIFFLDKWDGLDGDVDYACAVLGGCSESLDPILTQTPSESIKAKFLGLFFFSRCLIDSFQDIFLSSLIASPRNAYSHRPFIFPRGHCLLPLDPHTIMIVLVSIF